MMCWPKAPVVVTEFIMPPRSRWPKLPLAGDEFIMLPRLRGPKEPLVAEAFIPSKLFALLGKLPTPYCALAVRAATNWITKTTAANFVICFIGWVMGCSPETNLNLLESLQYARANRSPYRSE